MKEKVHEEEHAQHIEEKSALRMRNQFNSIQYNRGIEKFEKNTVCKQVLALV